MHRSRAAFKLLQHWLLLVPCVPKSEARLGSCVEKSCPAFQVLGGLSHDSACAVRRQ